MYLFFRFLTGHFSTLLFELLSTCPEEQFDSFFLKMFLKRVFQAENKWFQIFGRKLQAVLPNLNFSSQKDCFEVFLMKEA